MQPNTFFIAKAAGMSAYRDRIVVKVKEASPSQSRLFQMLDLLSMWGGSDKQMFGAPSWEMGVEELAVAVKWCKRQGLTELSTGGDDEVGHGKKH